MNALREPKAVQVLELDSAALPLSAAIELDKALPNLRQNLALGIDKARLPGILYEGAPFLGEAENEIRIAELAGGIARLIERGYLTQRVLTLQDRMELTDWLTAAVKQAQSDSHGELPADGMLTRQTIAWLNSPLPNVVRAIDPSRAAFSPGAPIDYKNGRPVIVVWMDEDENGYPTLPKIDGNSMLARSRLRSAFGAWEGRLKIDVVQTVEPKAANLLIRSGPIDGAGNVVAEAHIGPPDGTKLEIRFDEDEQWDRQMFEAAAVHAFGLILGIEQSDSTDSVMYPKIGENIEPTDEDLSNAEKAGWVRS